MHAVLPLSQHESGGVQMDTGWPPPPLFPSRAWKRLSGHLTVPTLPHPPAPPDAGCPKERPPQPRSPGPPAPRPQLSAPQADHKLQTLACPRDLLPEVTEAFC